MYEFRTEAVAAARSQVDGDSMTPTERLRDALQDAATRELVRNRTLAQWEMARRSYMDFLRFFVYTADQHDQQNPIKQAPYGKEYVRVMGELLRDTPLISIIKCRQIWQSWQAVTFCMHMAIFTRGRLIFFQSKREDDAVGEPESGTGLLGRAKFILAHMPGRDIVLPAGSVTMTYNMIVFKRTGSTIWAVPQGGDILRSHTPSMVLSDEAAFQPEMSGAYTAMRPALRGGARHISLTTPDLADGGHTRRLHEDKFGGGV